MTSPVDRPVLSDWELDGQRVAAALDECSAVLIIGEDPSAAAEVALGIGRVQARRRRVAVADAVGELGPIEDLLPVDTPYGLVDSILYGVSLTKIAHSIDPARNLFVLPSGTAPLDHDALLGSEEWARLARDFHAAEALMAVIVPPHIAVVGQLAACMDGVVLVGGVHGPSGVPVIAHLRPQGVPLLPPPVRRTPPAVHIAGDGADVDGGELVAFVPAARPQPRAQKTIWMWAAAAALVLGAIVWSARGRGSSRAADPAGDPVATASGDSVVPTAAPAARIPDSATAGWGLELSRLGSYTGAISRLELLSSRGLRAVTFAPITTADGNRSYVLVAGALKDSAAAADLLRALRTRRELRPTEGEVTHVPYALLVWTGSDRNEMSWRLRALSARGLPVYSLEESDGTLHIYSGAFTSREAAQLLVGSFRTNGESPTVTYRTGRAP